MFSDNNQISNRQLQILIITNNLGIGLILLPKIFFGYSILNMIILLCLVTTTIVLMYKATEKFVNENFFDYMKKNFGIYITKILLIFLLAKIILTTAYELKLFAWIIKIYVLPNTNEFVTNLILILAAGYLISKGYETRARLCEILIWLIVLPLAITFLISLFNLEQIIIDNNRINVKETFYSLFIFSQLDYLFLSKQFVKNSSYKKILQATFLTWLLITFLTYIINLRINFETPLPILKLMSMTDIPGGFVQNQDFFIISFVIISFFVLVSSGLFFSTMITAKKIPLATAITFFSLLIPNNFLKPAICILGSFFYFLLPLIILCKGGEKKLNT